MFLVTEENRGGIEYSRKLDDNRDEEEAVEHHVPPVLFHFHLNCEV